MNVTVLRNQLPREKWAKRISAAWREQLPSIFETGNLLEASKLELKHGEWTAMFQNNEVPFGQNMAFRLIKIAQNDNMRNCAHVHNLPVSWQTLYELTRLTTEQFEHGITTGGERSSLSSGGSWRHCPLADLEKEIGAIETATRDQIVRIADLIEAEVSEAARVTRENGKKAQALVEEVGRISADIRESCIDFKRRVGG